MSDPALIGLDWGTSSLRAMLIDAKGVVIEEVSRPWGITRLPPGGFVEAYEALTAHWRSTWAGLPCIACGMVGSRQGWLEAAYCSAPAGPDELAARLAVVDGTGLKMCRGSCRPERIPT